MMSLSRRLPAIALLLAAPVAFASTFVDLDDLTGPEPVDVAVDDGVIVLDFEIQGEDTFPFAAVLDGTVDADGDLVLNGDALGISGADYFQFGGGTHFVAYDFGTVGAVTGHIAPHDGDISLSFRWDAVLEVRWSDDNIYTCTGTTDVIEVAAADYNDADGTAVLSGNFELPSVSCAGPRFTAPVVQAAINVITWANPDVYLEMGVGLDPILTQAPPGAYCGSQPDGSMWSRTWPPRCDPDDAGCTVQSCTCDDGVTHCVDEL